jgi:hypothetical protein
MTLIEQLRSKKKALTVEELAGLLCVAVRTDHIPFFRVRTSIRFDPHQVADWLECRRTRRSNAESLVVIQLRSCLPCRASSNMLRLPLLIRRRC